jgi:hypothetical protein
MAAHAKAVYSSLGKGVAPAAKGLAARGDVACWLLYGFSSLFTARMVLFEINLKLCRFCHELL